MEDDNKAASGQSQRRHQDPPANQMEVEREHESETEIVISLPVTASFTEGCFESEADQGCNKGESETDSNLIDPLNDWNPTNEPMKDAIGIELIVKKIIFHMNFDTLKSARSTSRQWAYLASKELQKRTTIFLKYCSDRRNIIITSTRKTLDELNQLLEARISMDSHFSSAFGFPCSSFGIRDWMNIWAYNEGEAIGRFLSLHGTHIRKLKLTIFFDADTDKENILSQLRSLLIYEVPFLTTLKLGFWGERSKDEMTLFQGSEDCGKLLPSLRVIKMPYAFHRGIFEEICKEAPNLQEIITSSEGIPYVFKSSTQFQLLTEVYSLVYRQDDVEAIKLLGSGKHGPLQLRKLVLAVFFHSPCVPKLRSALNRMFSSTNVIIQTLIFNVNPALLGVNVSSNMSPCTGKDCRFFYFKKNV